MHPQEVIDKIRDYSPSLSHEWQWSIEEGKIRIALDSLHTAHIGCMNSLKATTSPIKHRMVEATRKIAKGDLVLVPLTSTIVLKKIIDDVPIGNVFLKVYKDPKGNDYNVVLTPSGGLKPPKEDNPTGIMGLKQQPSSVLIPFWLVKDSSKDDEINLVVKNIACDKFPAIKVPVFVNKKAIEPGDVLYASMQPLAPKATPDAIVATHPKKKAKKA